MYARDYKYILPQKFYYKNLKHKILEKAGLSSSDYRGNFSYVSIIPGTPAYLFSGSYSDGTQQSWFYEWKLDSSTGLINDTMLSDPEQVFASEDRPLDAFHSDYIKNIQGGIRVGNKYFATQTGQSPTWDWSHNNGFLDWWNDVDSSSRLRYYNVTTTTSDAFEIAWPHGLEDMHYTHTAGNVWTLTEYEADYDDIDTGSLSDKDSYGYENGRYFFAADFNLVPDPPPPPPDPPCEPIPDDPWFCGGHEPGEGGK